MKVIMVGTEKGGPGKTTLSSHIAGLLAARGKRVLGVDFDHQAHMTMAFGLDKEPGCYQVLAREDDIAAWVRKPDLSTFALPGKTPGQLRILPGNRESSAISVLASSEYALREALADVEDSFDVVVIDTGPAAGMLLSLAYKAADYIIIPAVMEYLSLDGLVNTVAAMKLYPHVKLMGIQPNMWRETDLHNHHHGQLVEAATEHGWTIWDKIYLRIIYSEAMTSRRLVYTLPTREGKAMAEMVRLAEQVEAVLNG